MHLVPLLSKLYNYKRSLRRMKVIASGITDVGCVRSANEDCFGLFHDINLYIVADGMGGHAAGEVASSMAVERMRSFFTSHPEDLLKQGNETRLVEAITYANKEIFKAGMQDASLAGMGTTVVSVLAEPEEVTVAYVGDSRLYLHQNGNIQQLTQDHSLVSEYIQKGLLTPEAAERHPQKHVLSRALGTGLAVDVEVFRRTPLSGDIYLLCSDGLSNKVTLSEMDQIISGAKGDLEAAGEILIERAKENGGEDNITALLVAYPG